MPLSIKPESKCAWDEVSLGEVMIRLDPGDGRIRCTREFKVWEGGGEYNVARGLKRCFGLNTTIVTAVAENDVGGLLLDLIYQGGVDTSNITWVPFDGIGRNVRVGLNFTERGFGIRAALGVSDRGNTAASQLKQGDIDWNELFKNVGARWFHCGGIFAALSPTTAGVVIEAMKAAKESGTIISYDLNYRESLWKSIGGKAKAQEVNREIAPYVDVMIGNEEDFTAALGFKVEGVNENLSGLDPVNFKKMIELVVQTYPNIQAVATTLRDVTTATINDWAAILYTDQKFYESRKYPGLEIYDRVGGGDSFASGLIYGLLAGRDPQYCVDCGAAHGALAMSTPGDTSMISQKEVEKLMKGGSARVQR
jgi:2-dehydro-3-deoxygluconokinase